MRVKYSLLSRMKGRAKLQFGGYSRGALVILFSRAVRLTQYDIFSTGATRDFRPNFHASLLKKIMGNFLSNGQQYLYYTISNGHAHVPCMVHCVRATYHSYYI